jgi:hypothetical protein
MLRQELEVTPSRRTLELYQQIRADRLESLLSMTTQSLSRHEPAIGALPKLLEQCKHLLLTIKSFEHEVQREVESLERNLNAEE